MDIPKKYTDLAHLPNNMSDEVLDANYNAVTRYKIGNAPVDEHGLVGTAEERDALHDAEAHADGDVYSTVLGSLRRQALTGRRDQGVSDLSENDIRLLVNGILARESKGSSGSQQE